MNQKDDEDTIDLEKPRRLDAGTISYLTQLEKQLEENVESDAELLEIFINNVLDEIKQRTASAACDRFTNIVMERICQLCM